MATVSSPTESDVLFPNCAGGASVFQQCLRAGLLDEFQIHLVPITLGGGVRLFEEGAPPQDFKLDRQIESGPVTHLRYVPKAD